MRTRNTINAAKIIDKYKTKTWRKGLGMKDSQSTLNQVDVNVSGQQWFDRELATATGRSNEAASDYSSKHDSFGLGLGYVYSPLFFSTHIENGGEIGDNETSPSSRGHFRRHTLISYQYSTRRS